MSARCCILAPKALSAFPQCCREALGSLLQFAAGTAWISAGMGLLGVVPSGHPRGDSPCSVERVSSCFTETRTAPSKMEEEDFAWSPQHPSSGSKHKFPGDVRAGQWREQNAPLVGADAGGQLARSPYRQQLPVLPAPLQMELAWHRADSWQTGCLHAPLAARASCRLL